MGVVGWQLEQWWSVWLRLAGRSGGIRVLLCTQRFRVGRPSSAAAIAKNGGVRCSKRADSWGHGRRNTIRRGEEGRRPRWAGVDRRVALELVCVAETTVWGRRTAAPSTSRLPQRRTTTPVIPHLHTHHPPWPRKRPPSPPATPARRLSLSRHTSPSGHGGARHRPNPQATLTSQAQVPQDARPV
jgi:hypothetical protein